MLINNLIEEFNEKYPDVDRFKPDTPVFHTFYTTFDKRFIILQN